MAKLKVSISKADYDALEDSLKGFYIEGNEGYKLDADYEDVTGLKAKRDELLGEITKLKETFKDIDPDAARQAMTELETARREKMSADELHAEDLRKMQEKLEAANQRSKALFETQAERDLHLTLANNKVRAEEIEDAAIVLRAKHLRAEEQDGKPVWKTSDGRTIEKLDEFITGLRDSKAGWFEPSTPTGSGASGSGTSGGNAKQWTRSQWESASTNDRTAFTTAGGQVTD